MKYRGFTLIELIMVIVIMGIIATSITLFLKPAIDSYVSIRNRAALTDLADTALRRMAQDIRNAVPNSIRAVSNSCFQFVPIISGGRYRKAKDTVTSAPLDITQKVTVFDSLSMLNPIPAVNDWIVINNQNTDDVYNGTNRAPIVSLITPPATDGMQRITINPKQFSSGYDGGRFIAVADSEQTIFYSCVGSNLYRTNANFNSNQATICAITSGALVSSAVSGCNFIYNSGATQQGGLIWMELKLTRAGETISLIHGVHVDNTP